MTVARRADARIKDVVRICGPMGLPEPTTTKDIVTGAGHTCG